MSALEVITVALAAGAGTGVKDTASAAVRDAYTGLKDLLRRRFDERKDAVLGLDADEADPAVWQARLGGALADSGAVDDEQILTAARELLAIANSEKTKMLRIDVANNHGAVGEFYGSVIFNQGPPVPPPSPAVL